ncbi:MAG: DUF4148 domain-containing protein [Comamonas sp.]
MNKKIILALASLTLAGGAFAVQTAEDPVPFVADTGAPVSRAQVQAELAQYQRQLASAPVRSENAAPVAAEVGQPLSRAQVQAELQSYLQHLSSRPAHSEDPAPL